MDLKLKVSNFLWKTQNTALTINKIAKSLEETYSNINKIVTRLVNEKVLDKKVVGHAFQCSINKNSDKAKALINLGEVERKEEYFKKHEKLALLFNDLLKTFPDNVVCVVLFGSYAKENF